MRYPYKYVKLPEGLKVGSSVYVSGEGDEVFKVLEIRYHQKTKQVSDIVLDCGWREPLSKICLKRGNSSVTKSMEDPSNWVFVAIGECDTCGKTFPDSCIYHRGEDLNSMVCGECWEVRKKEG